MNNNENINLDEIEFNFDEKRKIYGTWFLGRFLYWHYPVKKSISLLNNFKKKF